MTRFSLSLSLALMTVITPHIHAKILCEQPCHSNQGYELEDHQYLSAYNASSRYATTTPWNLFFEGSYIYWQPIETGVDVYEDASDPVRQVIDIQPNFSSSFKASLGVYPNNDNWLLSAQYMHFHNTSSITKSTDQNNTFYPMWFSHDTPISTANAKWKVHLDIIDLAIKRSGYTGKNVSFDLSSGLMIGRINQSFLPTYTFYSSQKTASGSNFSDSWIVGPEVGFKNKIMIKESIHIYNNLLAALCFQRYRLKSLQQNTLIPSQLSHRIHFKDSKLTPIASLATGLGFNIFATKQRFHLSLSVGYEAQVFWEQNFMIDLIEDIKSQISRGQDNLYLHGFTAKASLDF